MTKAKEAQIKKSRNLNRDVTDLLMGGTSAMFASMFTNPIEVVKTRLQLQGELKARGKHAVFYKNVPHAIFVVGKNEGLGALQRGLTAMLGFQFFLNIFRLGSFRMAERRGILKDASGATSLLKGAGVAGVGGALGSIAGTPFYLVKTRLQAQAAKAIAVGHQHKGTSTSGALIEIFRNEGFKGLFRGVGPQIPRGMAGSASQILSFTYAKEWLRAHNWFTQYPLMLSFFGANLGGIVMTLCLNPFDVIATRLCNQPVDANNKGTLYKGMIDCGYKMIRYEGPRSLYKGLTANYIRLGPHTVILLMCWDKLKEIDDYLRS
ncbi:solute carrier family 25 member 35-like isoform X1 [Spodoptera litura]|uniref:Solute carrier family 25 member 35-like isoform X1 n=1 Tax=Spodoptera litura TaxID=69820 RepID=A0A9J7E0N9_SPOLT|nr:solute carrier family 25 member 35-like isoform X1 [Spodoptera litura]XP_022819724.1 solute carrier family 25 member 35-like isoform X1 [Spodoptera litura]XP_022819725.1 solute carrier family 25 member 35-like isoform X1 [Spodoptera litura]XP_022819726.1 solute carrier family 25 member 35-like isoform X1 [Spodoptera litura]